MTKYKTLPSAVCRPFLSQDIYKYEKILLCVVILKTVNVMLIMYASNAFATIAGVSYVGVGR